MTTDDTLGGSISDLISTYGEFRVEEALSRLELALEDEGWSRLGAQSQHDFSPSGLKKIIELSRQMFLVNPLINHAVMVQADYVWAQGVNITPKAQLLAPVINRFLDHKGNKRELTGHQAKLLKEIAAQTDGNLFFALFTNRSTGAVRVRSVPIDEITQIVKNPEDAHEPWLYRREWTQLDAKRPSSVGKPRVAYYPDWLYRPTYKAPTIETFDVMWDSPLYHLKVGGTDQMSFGVPEVYAALDWARAVVATLEDYATIRRAHARFAWRFTTKAGPKGVAAARTKLGTTLGTDTSETNPPPVAGSAWIAAEGNDLQPFKTAGNQAPPDEARRMWLMVSAAVGIPETMLSGDATVGNYATAKTLDRPTELKMRDRQSLWAEVLSDILGYVIDQAAIAPSGPLKGKKFKDPYTEEISVLVLDGGKPIDRRIDIDFPPILERDARDRIEAIVAAFTANGWQNTNPNKDGVLIDLRTAMRLVLSAFGEANIDETLQKILPPDEPNPPVGGDTPDPALRQLPGDTSPAGPSEVPVPGPASIDSSAVESRRATSRTRPRPARRRELGTQGGPLSA